MIRNPKQNIILDGHKLYWHKERIEAWLRGERIAPITVDCALTRACSYRCVYCYGMLQSNKGYNLDKDTIFRFIDDAAEIGVLRILLFLHGEPMLHPKIIDMI